MENLTEMSDRAEQYHTLAKRWSSDLEFFQIETDFLLQLQRDYLIRLTGKVAGETLKAIDDQILGLQLDMHEAAVRCREQLDRLTAIAENVTPEDISYLLTENNGLADLMVNLNQEYQEVKKALFTQVKRVMHEYKLLTD